MAMDMGGPGIPGFGYGNQGQSGPRADNDQPQQYKQQQPEQQAGHAPETKAAEGSGSLQNQATNGMAAPEPEVIDVVPLDFEYADPVPGFEATASDCLNHALSIARSLNHVVLSSDHLMLALTTDPSARRLLDRLADVARLREVAMRRLGKMHSRYTAGDPAQTSDLEDIRKAARAAAAEREQLVAIIDLVNAFPKENGRLTYASKAEPRWEETIERGLVPRVSDAIDRIEAVVREATQGQRQTVQNMLEDLNARKARDEQQQREFMDEVRRQVREAVDIHVSAAIKDLDEKLTTAITALSPPKPEPVQEPPTEYVENASRGVSETPETPPSRRGYWTWGIL